MALDCRSENGVTVGLVDSLISICRVLAPRIKDHETREPGLFNASPVLESIKDLYSDEDLKFVLGCLPRWVERTKKLYPDWPGACVACEADHDLHGPCPQTKAYLFNKGHGGKPKEKDMTKVIVYEHRSL